MAEWSAAVVNNLPDSSFALILPGGEKDDEGHEFADHTLLRADYYRNKQQDDQYPINPIHKTLPDLDFTL